MMGSLRVRGTGATQGDVVARAVRPRPFRMSGPGGLGLELASVPGEARGGDVVFGALLAGTYVVGAPADLDAIEAAGTELTEDEGQDLSAQGAIAVRVREGSETVVTWPASIVQTRVGLTLVRPAALESVPLRVAVMPGDGRMRGLGSVPWIHVGDDGRVEITGRDGVPGTLVVVASEASTSLRMSAGSVVPVAAIPFTALTDLARRPVPVPEPGYVDVASCTHPLARVATRSSRGRPWTWTAFLPPGAEARARIGPLATGSYDLIYPSAVPGEVENLEVSTTR